MGNLQKVQKQYSDKIPLLIKELNTRLIERDELSRLVVLAIMSQNHMFLIGERGTAKTKTVELVQEVIEDTSFWQHQIGADTKIDELFGAKRADEKGEVKYISKRNVLNSHFVVLDEMFKGRGEMLNHLLDLLVSGEYTSGDGIKRKAKLISLFATSNEYPTQEIMFPFLDRFLFWYEVKRIQDNENRKKFFKGEYEQEEMIEKYFNADDLFRIKKEVKNIKLNEDIIDIVVEMTSRLIRMGVKTSDRKFDRTLQTAIKTSAYLNNRQEVDISDLFLFLHSSWHNHSEKDKVKRGVYETIFGVKDTIKGKIENLYKIMGDTDKYKNNKLFNYLHHKTPIKGNDRKSFFYNSVVKNIKEVYDTYTLLERELEILEEHYSYNLYIEKLIERNVFLTDIKQNVYDNKMLDDIKNMLTSLRHKKSEIDDWVKKSGEYYQYELLVQQKMAVA